MKARVYEVIQRSEHDEGNSYTRAIFDNEDAARAFIEALMRAAYAVYAGPLRSRWARNPDGTPPVGWTVSEDGTHLIHENHSDPSGARLKSWFPPEPVSYERWLERDFNTLPDPYGGRMDHQFDLMHSPPGLSVSSSWVYSSVPDLVTDERTGVINLTDELVPDGQA